MVVCQGQAADTVFQTMGRDADLQFGGSRLGRCIGHRSKQLQKHHNAQLLKPRHAWIFS
jgi:hypothetical protein